MNTFLKDVEDPLDAMQLGGSLMETTTVPGSVPDTFVLPPQLTPITAETKNAIPATNTPVFRWVPSQIGSLMSISPKPKK
jgi:hypothetical protein